MPRNGMTDLSGLDRAEQAAEAYHELSDLLRISGEDVETMRDRARRSAGTWLFRAGADPSKAVDMGGELSRDLKDLADRLAEVSHLSRRVSERFNAMPASTSLRGGES